MTKFSIDLAQHLERHLQGAVLDAMSREDVTDIDVNADGIVRLKTYQGPEETDCQLAAETIRSVLHLLADAQSDSLSTGKAFFAGRFPLVPPFDGARIHAVLPPVAQRASIAIRVHAPELFAVSDFASPEQVEVLESVVRASHNVLVIGGTSTGKTSFLNAILRRVAHHHPDDRILCLEDVREITVTSRDHLCLRTEGSDYTLEDLVAHSLRMNPSRLVVGEVRGGEALDLIDGWSTGHRGGFATVHAEDAAGALLRLERLARRHRRAGRGSLKPDIAAAVDVVVELRRGGDHKPRVAAIHSVAGRLTDGDQYAIEPL